MEQRTLRIKRDSNTNPNIKALSEFRSALADDVRNQKYSEQLSQLIKKEEEDFKDIETYIKTFLREIEEIFSNVPSKLYSKLMPNVESEKPNYTKLAKFLIETKHEVAFKYLLNLTPNSHERYFNRALELSKFSTLELVLENMQVKKSNVKHLSDLLVNRISNLTKAEDGSSKKEEMMLFITNMLKTLTKLNDKYPDVVRSALTESSQGMEGILTKELSKIPEANQSYTNLLADVNSAPTIVL